MEKYKISFIGSGNVAWHFAHALGTAGYPLEEIFSRNEESAKELVKSAGMKSFQHDLDFHKSKADLILLAVPDHSINEIFSNLRLRSEATLLSLSGSLNLSLLEKFHSKSGVFYPLQTFTKDRFVEISEVPFLLESGHDEVKKVLENLAASISQHLYFISSEQRKKIHLAAVFASNFTNYLIKISKDLLDKEGLSLDLLKPLIQETVKKATDSDPLTVQTGPARRGDLETIKNHLHELDFNKDFKEIYDLITRQILKRYQ